MNCRSDAVATIPLPLSGMFITPPSRHTHLTFQKTEPKTQPQPALARGIDPALHGAFTREQPPLCQEWPIALCFFTLEMRRWREDTVVRKDRGSFSCCWKQRGKWHPQTSAKENVTQRGAASWLSKQAFTELTLFLGRGFETRPGEQMCRCSLWRFPCLAQVSAAVFGHPHIHGCHLNKRAK